MTAAKTKESPIDVPELSIVVPIFNVEVLIVTEN